MINIEFHKQRQEIDFKVRQRVKIEDELEPGLLENILLCIVSILRNRKYLNQLIMVKGKQRYI